jgi:hypothetical protein
MNVLALALSLALPAAAEPSQAPLPAAAARGLALAAKAAAQDSSDMALSALYQRLFALQDKKRDAELRVDGAELELGDLALAYRKFDRRMDLATLKEVAVDPEHPMYPNITESSALKLVESARQKLRAQELARLEIKKLERDVKETEALIERHLQRGSKP